MTENHHPKDYVEFLSLYERALAGEVLRVITPSELGETIRRGLPRLRGVSELEYSVVNYNGGTVINFKGKKSGEPNAN